MWVIASQWILPISLHSCYVDFWFYYSLWIRNSDSKCQQQAGNKKKKYTFSTCSRMHNSYDWRIFIGRCISIGGPGLLIDGYFFKLPSLDWLPPTAIDPSLSYHLPIAWVRRTVGVTLLPRVRDISECNELYWNLNSVLHFLNPCFVNKIIRFKTPTSKLQIVNRTITLWIKVLLCEFNVPVIASPIFGLGSIDFDFVAINKQC